MSDATQEPADQIQTDYEIGQDNITPFGLDIHNPVFVISGLTIVAFVIVTLMFQQGATEFFGWLRPFLTSTFDWFFLAAADIFVLFSLFLMLSPLGSVRLGGPDAKPDYGYVGWFAMLFAAGMGIGLMFFGVSEPMSHFASSMGGTVMENGARTDWAPLGAAAGDVAAARDLGMAATIFALSGVAAPEGIDGKSLLPLLTNPKGQVRDHLPLFNFWGIESAQSMAIVTPGWKYIHWYYGKGMKPTDELFRLSTDGVEMFNTAENTPQAAQLDAEQSEVRPRVEQCDAPREHVRRDRDVAVEQQGVPAAPQTQSPVHRCCEAEIARKGQPSHGRPRPTHQLERPVPGAVVHDDRLDGEARALRACAIEGRETVGESRAVLEARNHDAQVDHAGRTPIEGAEEPGPSERRSARARADHASSTPIERRQRWSIGQRRR